MLSLGFVSAGYRYQNGDIGPGGGVVYMLPGESISSFSISNNTTQYFEIPDEDWYDGTDDPTAQWGCYPTLLGATGENFGDGILNTSIILSNCATAGIAARLCANWSNNGYDDWFFPALDELTAAIAQNDDLSLGLTFGNPETDYWTSSESGSGESAALAGANGGQAFGTAKFASRGVRPVRSFSARYV